MKKNAEMLFQEGFNCGQAVFASHSETLGMEEEQALKLASGLGAGMGRMQETCGAVTGACLVLGLRYGSTTVDNKAGKERTYSFVKALHEGFSAVHGTTRCRDLLGCDLKTKTGQDFFRERDLQKTVCVKCVETADALVMKMMSENS